MSVHAALGGGCPRRQPINGADSCALWARRQSERVLAAATATEGGGAWHSGDGGEDNSRNFVQLRPDECGARPSAGERLAAEAAERTGFVGDGLQICFLIVNSAHFVSASLLNLPISYIRPLFVYTLIRLYSAL